MDLKNLVIKSKSSNTAITSKPAANGGATGNKKSWSSARFGEVNSKKRGVYVEKKPPNTTLTRVAPGPSDVPKAPKRPRRGEKNFLNSCLSILSQETTATQFPETACLKSGKVRNATRKVAAETVDKGTQDLDAIYSGSNSPVRNKSNARRNGARNSVPASLPKQRKPRFRSKALNENFKDNKLVYLQHKRTFPRSPSMNSSAGFRSVEGRKGEGRPNLQPNTSHESKNEDKVDDKKSERCDKKQSDHTIDSKKKRQPLINDNVANGLISSVYDEVKSMATTESKKGKKVLRIEEPETLVSDYSSKNKSLYNFFVDLLETTCDVYNVQSNCKYPLRPNFEIEDNVAQKLQINEPNTIEKKETNFRTDSKVVNVKNDQPLPPTNEPVDDASRRLYFVSDDGVTDRIAVYQAGPLCHSWNPPLMKPKRYRSPYKPNFRRKYRETYGSDYRSNLKSESFRYAQQLKIQEAAKAESFMSPKKNLALKPCLKHKKRSLLSLLKEELQMDEDYFEEPASFHQALLIIARNKKRTQRAIHKDDSSVKVSVADRKSRANSSECFKRRRIISSSTKSPRRHRKNFGNVSFAKTFPTNMLSRDISMTVLSEGPPKRYKGYESDECSVHSIEVDAYDYAPNQYVRRLDTNTNEAVYSSNSGVSLRSETITSSKDYLECLEKCGRSLSPSAPSGTVSTAISQLLLRDVYNNDLF